MELKEFINTVLIEIADGIKTAQPYYNELGGAVNPQGIAKMPNGNYCIVGNAHHKEDCNFSKTDIEFEVGLTNANGTENKGGLGVFLGSIGIGTGAKEHETVTAVTKIKFSIPVVFPSQQMS